MCTTDPVCTTVASSAVDRSTGSITFILPSPEESSFSACLLACSDMPHSCRNISRPPCLCPCQPRHCQSSVTWNSTSLAVPRQLPAPQPSCQHALAACSPRRHYLHRQQTTGVLPTLRAPYAGQLLTISTASTCTLSGWALQCDVRQ